MAPAARTECGSSSRARWLSKGQRECLCRGNHGTLVFAMTPFPQISEVRGGFVHVLFAVVLASAALYLARVVLEPIAFALFGIALVWPLQKALEARMPKSIALAVTILVTLVVIFVLAGAIVWSIGDVVHWILANLARFQSLYVRATQWLEGHGIFITEGVGQYNIGTLVGFLQEIAMTVNSLAGF